MFRPQRYKITERVTLKTHHSKLLESPKIKYLGLILDNKLDWKGHITELSKKLSRAVGLLYKIRNLCPTSVLRSLYYSIFNSHLLYGLVVWGNANRSYINKIKYLQKRARRCIVFANYDKNIDTNSIHFDLKILNLDHQFQTQLSSLMWDYDHDVLPLSLRSHFKRANLVHTSNTRTAAKGSLHYSKVNTSKYGLKSFKYQGIKILNDLKQMSIYQTATSESIFVRELKYDLLSSYTARYKDVLTFSHHYYLFYFINYLFSFFFCLKAQCVVVCKCNWRGGAGQDRTGRVGRDASFSLCYIFRLYVFIYC